MDEVIPEPEGWQDSLTGLDGPDFWQRVLAAEVNRAARYGRALTVILMELEGLEQAAAASGPGEVARVLRAAGQCLLRNSRPSEYCARIEGARFGVILTETDEISAINFIERVRAALPRAMPPSADGVLPRFGWASPRARESAAAVVLRADRRLADDPVG